MYKQKKQKKALAVWAVVVVILGLLAGCSSANSDSANSKPLSDQFREEADGTVATEASVAENGSEVPQEVNVEALSFSIAATAGGGFAADTAVVSEEWNQKIIYTASLNMQVALLAEAATELRNAIHQSGGYILQFQDTRNEGEIGSTYTIKVPADGFMSFIDRIEQIKHKDFERKIGGKDVSEEYVDLESRLKAKQLVETRLLTLMEKAGKADDLLKFSQQLASVQEEIEQIKGRIRYLDKNVAFSTVELRMYQTEQTLIDAGGEKKHLGGKMAEAISGSTKVVWETLKLLLIVIAGAVPIIAVLAVIAVPAIWLAKRNKKGRTVKLPEQDEEQPPTL
ncbi:DUF4349 domain-containing protein [Paenibacillus luteus]|uniref:DUF4349 domain-containing protein n=1 Tax=Paenibacillus luteus TaxID=2545753 RepID=UPI0011442E38|nr:DUF4349 domain-containing protein [Paenibacillus luteus]